MTPVTGPSCPEEMTAEWMTQALRDAGVLPNGSVAALDINVLGRGHGMTGQVARVGLKYQRDAGQGVRSLIAKFPAAEGPIRDLASRFRLYEREAHFYRELGTRAGVPSPRLYYSGLPGCTALLLEDVLDAQPGDLLAGCSLDNARLLLQHLARVHARWWGSPELDALGWLPAPDDPSTLAYAEVVARDAWKSFRRKAPHLPPVLVEIGDRLAADYSVLTRLGSHPRTLVHGDMRVNNVLWAVDGSLRAIIDWQTVVAGRGPIDIASLFVNGLQPGDRRTAERELLPEYHQALVDAGVEGYSYEMCWIDYRLAVMNQFSEAIVISALIDVGSGMDDDVTAVTGMRMFTALMELDVVDLVPPATGWRTWLSRARSAVRF